MIDSLVRSVRAALSSAFPAAAVYESSVPHGAVLPCFFVTFRSPDGMFESKKRFSVKQILGNRYLFSIALCVEFHYPAGYDFMGVIERLFANLQLVDIEGHLPVRGDNCHCEVKDDSVYFFVTYEFFASFETETVSADVCELMENYKFN